MLTNKINLPYSQTVTTHFVKPTQTTRNTLLWFHLEVRLASRWASGSSSPSSSTHESFEEVAERTIEDGDLAEVDGRFTGGKVVQFEKVTVHRSVREYTPKVSSVKSPSGTRVYSGLSSSRSPSEEQLTREDSAYLSQRSVGSRTSSVTSLASGRSEENLQDEGHQWYQDYRQHAFKKDTARSRSQYDSHIKQIRGEFIKVVVLLHDLR